MYSGIIYGIPTVNLVTAPTAGNATATATSAPAITTPTPLPPAALDWRNNPNTPFGPNITNFITPPKQQIACQCC